MLWSGPISRACTHLSLRQCVGLYDPGLDKTGLLRASSKTWRRRQCLNDSDIPLVRIQGSRAKLEALASEMNVVSIELSSSLKFWETMGGVSTFRE
jgi:hypothetical protein